MDQKYKGYNNDDSNSYNKEMNTESTLENNIQTDSTFNIYKILKNYILSKKSYLIGYFVLTLSSPLSDVVLPKYYGKVVNKFTTKESIVPEIRIIVIGWLIYEIMTISMNFMDATFIPEMQAYLRKEMVRIIFETFSFTNDDLEIGKIINKLTQVPMICSELVYQVRNYMLPAFYTIIFSIFFLFKVNLKLGLIALGIILLYFLINYILIKKIVKLTETFQLENEKTAEYIAELLENLQTIYSNDTMDQELINLSEKNKDVVFQFKQNLYLSAIAKLFLNSLYFIIFIACNGYNFYLFKNKIISVEDISSSFFVILYLINQLSNLSGEFPSFIFYLGVLNDIQRYLNGLEIIRGTGMKNVSTYLRSLDEPLKGNIEFKNVKFQREHKIIFDQLNIRFNKNTKTLIRGKIGSGKTTFINLIMGYCLPTNGNIEFDGKLIHPQTLRKYISYVRQNPKLFNTSIYHNITYGIGNVNTEHVEELMQKYDLSEIFRNHKLEDSVGKGGSHLSGGQKQIVLLLHAIIKDCPILILDEPTASLDGNVKEKVIQILKDLFQNKTVFVITHDDTLLNYQDLFDSTLYMNDISKVV